MNNQILEYLANSHSDYIHAKGKQSTDKIIQLLEPRNDEKILEIGFGTGATLVQIAEKNNAQLIGYELSPIMYGKALKRIGYCNLSARINIELLNKKNHFSASDNTFDKVYAESILAIQENDELRTLLLEIKRVLKPNGILLFNETIWLESTTKDRANQINQACMKSFGIIQSNDKYMHVSDWKNLLEELGFQIEIEKRVDEIPTSSRQVSLTIIRSKLFTLSGKFKALMSPSMRRTWREFERNMQSIIGEENLMEGVIIKAYNK